MKPDIDEFFFGVLLYNQQDLVAETLESIKYQIEEYQGASSFGLFVIDDCSVDGSAAVVSEWLLDNKQLFDRIELIVNDTNKGTVHNFNKLLHLFGLSTFKIIAGDDLFSSRNLLAEYRFLDDRTLVTHPRLDLIEGAIKLDRSSMNAYYCKMIDHEDGVPNIQAMRQGCYLHTPSTIFSQGLYEKANCASFNRQFRLFEDDPTWYSMMKNESDLRIIFRDTPIVLYRVHLGSVSNAKNKYRSQFDLELEMLRDIYINDAKGREKMLLEAEIRTDRLPALFNIRKWKQLTTLVANRMRIKGSNLFEEFRHDIENAIIVEQLFYDDISAKAIPYKVG